MCDWEGEIPWASIGDNCREGEMVVTVDGGMGPGGVAVGLGFMAGWWCVTVAQSSKFKVQSLKQGLLKCLQKAVKMLKFGGIFEEVGRQSSTSPC